MYLLPLIAPALLLAAGGAGLLTSGLRPRWLLRVSELATIAALGIALATMILIVVRGPGSGLLVAVGRVILSARVDAISVTMLLLVSFIGWVVVRYSANYLDGEPRQGPFMGWLCLTLAAVLTLVAAGNLVQFVLAWIATSVFLHRLLLFYPDRVAAQRAARKKFVAARAGDAALIAASVLLVVNYGTTDIAQILEAARGGPGSAYTSAAAGMLAVAALLKSAQFPTHGWLTEVMETPTPVSALLHAGVINAGGFLLIRFANVMVLSPSVLAALVMVGGFTALFGGLVMLTQPAVETSLAWSTVAQMDSWCWNAGLRCFRSRCCILLRILCTRLIRSGLRLGGGHDCGESPSW